MLGPTISPDPLSWQRLYGFLFCFWQEAPGAGHGASKEHGHTDRGFGHGGGGHGGGGHGFCCWPQVHTF